MPQWIHIINNSHNWRFSHFIWRIPANGEIPIGPMTNAWLKDDWTDSAFSNKQLMAFIERRVEAEEVTQRKVFTNYRYMLKSAGVLVGERLQPGDLRQRWLVDAVQLFWDREIFDGSLNASASLSVLENALIDAEIYKLLRCSKDQCRAFARAAFAEFSHGQGAERAQQLQSLRDAGAIAA
jgi:hypothetical protein